MVEDELLLSRDFLHHDREAEELAAEGVCPSALHALLSEHQGKHLDLTDVWDAPLVRALHACVSQMLCARSRRTSWTRL